MGKLQEYLRLVEGELSDRLNKRSEAFFKAFDDLQNLHTTVKDTFSKAEDLKFTLNMADNKLVRENLVIYQKQERKDNLVGVLDKLKTLAKVTKVLPIIKERIEEDDLHIALNYISQIQTVLKKDLFGLSCIVEIQKRLDEMNHEIDQKFVRNFVLYACGEGPLTEEAKNKLEPIVIELMSAGKMPSTLDSYLEIQERTVDDIFTKVWKGDDDPKATLDGFEKICASMDADKFIMKLKILFSSLTKQTSRAKSLRKFMESVFKNIDTQQKRAFQENDNNGEDSKESARKLVEEQQLRMKILIDFENILAQSSSHLINTRISKIFNSRTDIHKRITQSAFAELFNTTMKFIVDGEDAIQRENHLRLTLSTFKTVFLEANQSNKISKLTGILENETWFRAEIAKEFYLILQCLLDPEKSLDFGDINVGDNVKDINYEGERYLLVNSTLLFAKMLYDYIVLLESTPAIYQDIIIQMVDLLKVFQKNVHELILERKAVKISTLKSISATHLALSWQTLSMMIVLIPRIKDRILTLVSGQDIDEDIFEGFDSVLKDYTDHRQEVISRIVSLMSDRLDILFKAFKIDELATEPSKPFVQLADKTKVLHKILKATLHMQYFQITFKQIILLYNYKLITLFSTLTIKSPKEKQKLLNDVYYFLEKIRELPGIEDPTDEMAEYVHANVK